jgi:hypothetical protein
MVMGTDTLDFLVQLVGSGTGVGTGIGAGIGIGKIFLTCNL